MKAKTNSGSPSLALIVARMDCILISLISIFCGFLILTIPTDPKNWFIFSLSLRRIAMIAFFAISAVLPVFLLIKLLGKRKQKVVTIISGFVNKKFIPYLAIVLLITLTTSWYLTFISNTIPNNWMAFYTRIQPFLIWSFLFSLVNIFVLLILRVGFQRVNFLQQWRINRRIYIAGLVSFFILIAIWLFIIITKYGITPIGFETGFWVRNGVPVLNAQILITSVSLLIIYYLVYKVFHPNSLLPIKTNRAINIGIFILIWIIASAVWIATPQPTSLYNPGPVQPGNDFYPWSDAQVYDNCAQFVFIGQKYCNGSVINYPMYDGFLLFLHVLGGQNNSLVISLQVIVIALVPAIIFLMGKLLFNRFAGLLASAFTIFQVRNSLLGGLQIWNVSYPKMMMTEPLCMLVLVLFSFWFIKYLQNTTKNHFYVLLSGMILGLATLVRHNVWSILPVFGIAILFSTKKFVKVLAFFVLGFFLATGPWAIRNVANGSQPFYVLEYFQGYILQSRYQQQNITDENQTDTQPNAESTATRQPTQQDAKDSVISNSSTAEQNPRDFSTYQIILSNLLRNSIASFLALPTTHTTGSLKAAIQNAGNPSLWADNWAGGVNFEQATWIVVNLLVISVGIGAAIHKYKMGGMVPLIVFIMYDAGLAIAKTSGGRYIAPINWIVIFYYALGLTQIILFFLSLFKLERTITVGEGVIEEKHSTKTPKRFRSEYVLIAFLLAISILLPASEYIFPKREYSQDKNSIRALLKSQNITDSAITKSLEDSGVQVLYGKAFYPKVFLRGDENLSEFFPFLPQDRMGLFITVLNQNGRHYVYLPLEYPLRNYALLGSMNGIDVVVFGEKGTEFKYFPVVDIQPYYATASAMIFFEKQPVIYYGTP
jgi:hypothetical protein